MGHHSAHKTGTVALNVCEDCHQYFSSSVLYSDDTWATYQCNTESEADKLLSDLNNHYNALLDEHDNTYGILDHTGDIERDTQESCECCGTMSFGDRYGYILS